MRGAPKEDLQVELNMPDAPPPPVRDGKNPIEQMALARVVRDRAAMPASLIVQLALWPETIADWSRALDVKSSVVYNMLAGQRTTGNGVPSKWRYKPYHAVRRLLAERLNVEKQDVDYLIDTPPGIPPTGLPAKITPGDVFHALGIAEGRISEIDSREPLAFATTRTGVRRDGRGAIEILALSRVMHELPSLSASTVIQLVLYPTALADWAERVGVRVANVYAMLSGPRTDSPRWKYRPLHSLRELLAMTLKVDKKYVDRLVEHKARVATAKLPPQLTMRSLEDSLG